MRKWRNCTSLHSTVLTQEQEDYIGVKVEGPLKGGHYRYQDSRFIRRVLSLAGVFEAYLFDCRKKSIWANSPVTRQRFPHCENRRLQSHPVQ